MLPTWFERLNSSEALLEMLIWFLPSVHKTMQVETTSMRMISVPSMYTFVYVQNASICECFVTDVTFKKGFSQVCLFSQ